MSAEIKVTLGNYKGIKVPAPEITVTEEELKAELQRACQCAAKQEEKETEAAVMGDETVIDFVGYIDDEAFPGGDGSDYPLTLGSGMFIPGFEEQLVGSHKGDKVDVKVAFPENYHAPEYAGKDAVFKVEVKKVRATIVPELSDEVVAQVSEYKTVDEFTEYVKDQIREAKSNHASQSKENYILNEIVEASEVVIPDEAIDERANVLKQNMEGQLRNSGHTMEEFLQFNSLTPEKYEEYIRNDAMAMLRGQAVLAEIGKMEGYTCSEEELENEVGSVALSYGMPVEEIRKMMGEEGMKLLAQDVIAKKALELVVKEAEEV